MKIRSHIYFQYPKKRIFRITGLMAIETGLGQV